MTVIAWDGATLAADKRALNNGHAATTTKIFRVNGSLIGFAGDVSWCYTTLAWFRDGKDPEKYPKQKEGDNSTMIEVQRDGRICKYEHGPYPTIIEDKTFAAGAGRDYALAALLLGHTAVRAVEVACDLDVSCGNGIDTLTFDEEPRAFAPPL